MSASKIINQALCNLAVDIKSEIYWNPIIEITEYPSSLIYNNSPLFKKPHLLEYNRKTGNLQQARKYIVDLINVSVLFKNC